MPVDVEASSFVPVHPVTDPPPSGEAVSEMDSPLRYIPAGQPVELVGDATGSDPAPLWERVSVKQGGITAQVTETLAEPAPKVTVFVVAVEASLSVPLQLPT